jgi:hypothetical protein
MNIFGLLSFYDEQPEHLARAIGSLARAGVSHLVAVDGAYRLFPDAGASSGQESHDAIRGAARAGGIGLTLHVPGAPYQNNEVEKRTLMFALGHALAAPSEDWLFVLDADEEIVECGDILAALEATEYDVASIRHGEPSVRPRLERRLFRAHPKGITVRQVHFNYMNGDGDRLWGPGQVDREVLEQVLVMHRPLDRDRTRNKRRNRYYEDRLIMRAEPELAF